MPFGWLRGVSMLGGHDVELVTGQALLVIALLVLAVVTVMWVLAATRSSQR